MTVDPQNDICPHGRTYPINAVPIIINNIITPIFQVSLNINDLKYIPRPIWKYKQKKNIEAPLAWIFRNKNPFQASFIILFTLLNAIIVSGVYRKAKNSPLIIWIIKHNPNIDRSRIFFGQCSEICGANHSFIPITIERISLKYFLKWLNNNK